MYIYSTYILFVWMHISLYILIVMGISYIMDSVLYISLAITFVLILLIVYHFKQRISALETKQDTMYELVNNIVEEINTRRPPQTMESGNIFGYGVNDPTYNEYNRVQELDVSKYSNDQDSDD